jgi:tellurite resistance protein
VFQLPTNKLQELRQRLHMQGQRRSTLRLLVPNDRELAEAVSVVEEYGVICEVLYLMMAADRRVLNVEREVMKGALGILSAGRVRTAHLEAMLDASARRVAELGEERCLDRAIQLLRGDPVRAEATVVLAAAVALADGTITAEEQALLARLAEAFELDQNAAVRLLNELNRNA